MTGSFSSISIKVGLATNTSIDVQRCAAKKVARPRVNLHINQWAKSRGRGRSHNAHLLDVSVSDSHFEHRTEKRSRAVDMQQIS